MPSSLTTPLHNLPFHDVPFGVCVIKRNRKGLEVLYANSSFVRLLNKKSIEDLVHKKFKDILPDHKDRDALVTSLKSPTPMTGCNVPTAFTENGTLWAHFEIRESKWSEEPCYNIWAYDISSNKEEEENLLQAVAEADATAEMKSNFLATMSHEIRTPMQSIYGLLELINEEKPNERISSMVHIAQDSAAGLLGILDDILDVAKMDADKMELDVFEVPVRMLVRGTLEALNVKTHGKSVELIDDIDKDVPFVVIGDPKRLRQIIMNLTGNALKFTPNGSVTVRVDRNIQHITLPENRVGLRFEIIDTGIGMAPEVCEKLFGAFAQADNSTSRKFGGTGLGLHISQKLVKLMGGKIGVESVEGKGSTFWFEIATEEVSTETTTIELPDLTGISVLSVEDHPQGAKEIINSLQSMGAKVENCSTIKEGLDLVKRRPFDVGVIDQGLPDGLGLDLIKQIMDIRPNMGLIMYTARADSGLSHSLQTLGVTYLTKPASRAGLGEAVQDAAAAMEMMSIEGPQRLLIAEDTESVRDVIGRQLANLGVEADFAQDGREALDMLESGAYGILITDLHMPEVDGYQVVETLRKKEEEEKSEKRFPIIVLTADVQMAHRDAYMAHGFDECLLKPVSLGQFRRLLIRWGILDDSVPPVENTSEANSITEADIMPAVDIECIKHQMGAFDEGAIDMMKMFLDMTEPLMKKLEDSYDRGDLHELQENAHSLKGAARSACCNILGEIAAQLQDQSEAGVLRDDLIEAMVKEFARVKSEILKLKV